MTLFEVFLSIYLTRRPRQMILPGRGGFAGFLFTVLTAVDLLFLVGEYEDMGKLLLYGSDTSGIVAADNVLDLFGKHQILLFHDFPAFNDIDGNVMVIDLGSTKVRMFKTAIADKLDPATYNTVTDTAVKENK